MADAVPAMSGAKGDTVPIEAASQAAAGEASIAASSTEIAAKEMAVVEATPMDAAATVVAAGTTDMKNTQSATEAESEPSVATPEATADEALQVPQPPPPAVTRDRGDSLSIGVPDDGTTSADCLVCNITLLLPTGARHPYRIDEKYLAKRNVDVPGLTEAGKKDPFSISVYKLKELILREWREDWEGKPASPSSIRLIHFGKLLEDKEQLNKYHFSAEAPNVVHMSVKPPEMLEEEEAGKSKTNGRETRSREGGAGCCVIL